MSKLKQSADRAPKKDADALLQEQNASVKKTPKSEPVQIEDNESPAQPNKGKKLVKVLGKKKTIRDNKGDEWEVVDKRETFLKEKAIDTDSDEGSELSMDWFTCSLPTSDHNFTHLGPIFRLSSNVWLR